MTIDEPIKDAKECDGWQVAEWLEELKAIKENAVSYSTRPIEDIVFEARAVGCFTSAEEAYQQAFEDFWKKKMAFFSVLD